MISKITLNYPRKKRVEMTVGDDEVNDRGREGSNPSRVCDYRAISTT